MSEQQARRLKPGQIVIYDGDKKVSGTVLGILRSGVSIHWHTNHRIEIVMWRNVEHLSVWESN